MVKQVARWQAKDGTLFDTEDDAINYELRDERIEKIYRYIHNCMDMDHAEQILDFIEEHTKGWK